MSVHRRQQSIEMLEFTGVPKENGNQQPLLHNAFTPLTDDFVVVGKRHKVGTQEHKKQREYISKLKNKKFTVRKILDEENEVFFFGIKAPKEIFLNYSYLLKVADPCNWNKSQDESTVSTRIRIVHFVINHTKLDSGENLRELIKTKVFETRFCLHEKNVQKTLVQDWARWTAFYSYQPIDKIRNYFGEKVALYFLWLGSYTFLLIPPALIGILVFLYGLTYFNTSPLVKEVCESNEVMCPLCDKGCKAWKLSETCSYAKLSLLFDNNGTFIFAMFMAIWTTLFFEYWKRHRANTVCKWNLYEWSETEEDLIMEIVNDTEYTATPKKHSYAHNTLVLTCVACMILLTVGLTHTMVVVRVVVAGFLSRHLESNNSNIGAMLAGGLFHFFIISIMTRINRKVAMMLCNRGMLNSISAIEQSFTVKMFTLQFFTYFCSLFYVAFFLGRINGHPGEYVRIAGKYRLEECHPSGCLTDLFIQMTIIMVLKQTLNNMLEIFNPWFHKFLSRRHKDTKLQRKSCNCFLKDESRLRNRVELCDDCTLKDWTKNQQLTDTNSFSLFNEYLEMVIQFSFTTIFVAAFPLAPLFALLNNVIEIRLDAIKMVKLERRMVPMKTNNIGVWLDILEAIGVLAVIVNGLVIGVSSDFVPRIVYRYRYGPCAKNIIAADCMEGYINNTLSIASMNDSRVMFEPNQMITPDFNATSCSYKDYRNEDFSFTEQFWLILAVRFAFVILFEHVLVICKFIVAWFLPAVPMCVKNEKVVKKLRILRDELCNFKPEICTIP